MKKKKPAQRVTAQHYLGTLLHHMGEVWHPCPSLIPTPAPLPPTHHPLTHPASPPVTDTFG